MGRASASVHARMCACVRAHSRGVYLEGACPHNSGHSSRDLLIAALLRERLELTVGAAMTITVGAALAETVGGVKTESVGLSKTEDIGSNKTLTTGKSLSENIKDNRTVQIGKDLMENVTGKHREEVKKEYMVQAKKIQLTADDQINIKTGKAEIIMKKNGDITIKGKKINIKGSGDVIIKGSKIKEN